MRERLKRSFFTQPTLTVAKKLLGKYLCRKIGKQIRAGKIVETEAYIGPKDRASHAYLPRRNFQKNPKKIIEKIFGKKLSQNKVFLENFLRGSGKLTKKNMAEYMVGGHIYIYLVYGMYWQMNISTSTNGKPECVLIRALEPSITREICGKLVKIRDIANGPGKLCQWLKLDKSFYGEDVIKSKRIWTEDRGVRIMPCDIVSSPRIGIDYAGPIWSKKPWRFYLKNNPFVSKSHPVIRRGDPVE